MTDQSESEVEVDPYEEIVILNLNYSTPMASRASSPLPRERNESNMTQFNGPIVSSSESEVVGTSTGLVASVTWPSLRYPCSLAGSYEEPRLLKHLDGNLRATHRGWLGVVDTRSQPVATRRLNAGWLTCCCSQRATRWTGLGAKPLYRLVAVGQ